MKHTGHLTFQCIIDYWGEYSDEGMPGTILSCNVVATCGFSKQKLGILSSIRQGNNGTSKKSVKQGRSPKPVDILVDI